MGTVGRLVNIYIGKLTNCTHSTISYGNKAYFAG